MPCNPSPAGPAAAGAGGGDATVVAAYDWGLPFRCTAKEGPVEALADNVVV